MIKLDLYKATSNGNSSLSQFRSPLRVYSVSLIIITTNKEEYLSGYLTRKLGIYLHKYFIK